jgi:Base plate wedge protein 53
MYFINTDRDIPNRYDIAKFVEWYTPQFESPVYDILFSYFWNEVVSLPQGGVFTVSGEENRPDLVSYKIYGNTQYWWIILLYNGLSHNEEVVAGLELKYPLLIDLESLYFKLMGLSR